MSVELLLDNVESKCQIETNLQVYEVHDANLGSWGAGRCLGKLLGLLESHLGRCYAGKPLGLLESHWGCWKPLGLLESHWGCCYAGKPLGLLGSLWRLLLHWGASEGCCYAGKPLGLLGSLWGLLEMSLSDVILKFCWMSYCSDMINWSGNQCEGIIYVTLLLKDNQVLLPYWTWLKIQCRFSTSCRYISNTVHQIQLTNMQFIIKYSSSNTVHRYAVHHQIQFIKYSCNKTYIHTIFSAGYKMCRQVPYSSNVNSFLFIPWLGSFSLYTKWTIVSQMHWLTIDE